MRTAHLVALGIVLGIFVLLLMAAVTRFLVPKHDPLTNTRPSLDADVERHQNVTHLSLSWKRRFSEKQKHTDHRWVPSFSAIIEAGDESFFASDLFHEHHHELHLEDLYHAFATKLRNRSASERAAYSDKISKFLVESKPDVPILERAKSISRRVSTGPIDTMQNLNRRNSNSLSPEGGLKRSLSVKKPAPTLVPFGNGLPKEEGERPGHDSWMNDFQLAGNEDGLMFTKPSPIELATASIILASPLTLDTARDNAATGAFGISMSMTSIEDNGYHVTLQGHARSVSQQHAQGVGVSTLFAKHLAAGSLPYVQDREAVYSMLITDETLESIQAGLPMQIYGTDASTAQSKFLFSLPSSRPVKFSTLVPSTEQVSWAPLIDAITGLPFSGGLPPLVSRPLVETIRFIAAGGLEPGRLLQRLEDLVDKVNSHAPHLDIFGPLYRPHNAGLVYRERARLGKLAKTSAVGDSLADKTARMSRYITLLQRLMALLPDMKQKDSLTAVRAATKTQLQRSYAEAVVAQATAQFPPNSPIHPIHLPANSHLESQSTASTTSASLSNNSSVATKATSYSISSPATCRTHNWSKQVEKILKQNLPLDVNTIACLARMVILAWTQSVEIVAWEDGEEGFRVLDVDALDEDIILC